MNFSHIRYTLIALGLIVLYTLIVPSLVQSPNNISVLAGIIFIKVGIVVGIVTIRHYFYNKVKI